MITVIMTDRSTGKMTRKKICIGPAPSTMAASSSSRGTDGDEGPEQQDAERHAVGDLDQDQAGHGLEQAELLQHPDGGNDGRGHDQPGQDQDVDRPGRVDRAGVARRRRPLR